MKKRSETLTIGLNGKKVGVLHKAARTTLSFQYADSWLASKSAMPISLSMPLQKQAYSGPVVASYFGNLLPDTDQVLRQIAERVGAKSAGSFDLLAQIGRDCVGALQFILEGEAISILGMPSGTALNEGDIENVLQNLGRRPLGMDTDKGFRISIAGAQEKAAFLHEKKSWLRPIGATPTTHIFKPALGFVPWESGDVDMRDSVWNEHYCLTLFNKFGFETAKTSVERFGEVNVLSVKRFDRIRLKDGVIVRLPQEDMCQSLGVPSSMKYQNDGGPTLVEILKILGRSDTPHKDQQAVFRAQALFFLIGAIDGHAKNFSIFLRPGGRFQLTPLYDIISAEPAFESKQIKHKDYRLAMSVGKKPHYKIKKIHGRYFLESAIAANLSEEFAREAISHIQDHYELAFEAALDAMPEGFPVYIHDAIKSGLQNRLPALETAFG